MKVYSKTILNYYLKVFLIDNLSENQSESSTTKHSVHQISKYKLILF